YDIFVQSIAIVAVIIFALSFHAKTRNKILVVNTASLFVWCLHFLLLHAWTGAMLSGLNFLISNFLIFKDQKSWIADKKFLFASMGLLVVGMIITWQGFFSIFALAGIASVVLAKWHDSTKTIRLLTILSSFFWITYDYFAGSSGGIIAETIIVLSILWSLYSNRQKQPVNIC